MGYQYSAGKEGIPPRLNNNIPIRMRCNQTPQAPSSH